MSELKVRNSYQLTINTEDSDVYIHNDYFGCGGYLVECYLKSEADKVIARHKYKRCLAMAKWCFTKSNYHFVLARHGEDAEKNCRKSIRYSKWHRRWFTIADKFNPNSTAQ